MENVSCSRPSVILEIEQGLYIVGIKWNQVLYQIFRFEPRWLKSLSQLKIPIQLLWGDSDSVSPVAIPTRLAAHINPDYLTFKLMSKTGEMWRCRQPGISLFIKGHFLTLEQPEDWIQSILHFINERWMEEWLQQCSRFLHTYLYKII